MFIRKIELTNFRSYDYLTLTFDQARTLIIGENGDGKSTIVDAIALVLTGRCRGVNERGEGQRELIRTGTEQASVALTIDGLDPFTVTIDQKRGTTRSHPVDVVLGQLRTTKPFVTAALYGSAFFDLHHADAKKLLMRLLDVRVPVPVRQGMPAGSDDGTDLLDLDEVERRYKEAFDLRAGLKRALPALAVPDLVRRADLEQLNADTLAADVRSAQVSYQAAVELTADVRAQTAALAKQKTALAGEDTQPILGSKLGTHEDLLKEHLQHLANARAKLEKAKDKPVDAVNSLTAQVHELKLFIQRVEGHAGKAADPVIAAECVLGKGIPCLTPAQEFQDAIRDTKKQVADLEKRVATGTKLAEAIAAATAQVKDGERNVANHEGQITKLRQQITDEQKRLADLAQVTADLDELQPEATASSNSIVNASAKLAQVTALEREYAAYRQLLTNRDGMLERLQEAQSDLAEAEQLVDLLGPNGARQPALQAAVDDFHQAINAALQPFQFELAINVDPWLVRVVHRNTKGPLPFDLLSKGEKIWTGLAFQLALAAVSGLEFCLVDDAEGVVGRSLQMLTALVMAAPVGQVIVVKAQAAQQPAPELAGLQVIRVVSAQTALTAGMGA